MSKRLRATVLLSGGLDSAACAAFLLAQGFETSALFINYGQAAARREAEAVAKVAKEIGIDLDHLTVTGSRAYGSGELVGRNAFLIFAALFSRYPSCDVIAMGLHAGTPYYDCSPAFLESINRLVAEHTDNTVRVHAPFIDWSKRDVHEYFLGAGLTLEQTYSCEQGTWPPCGRCASCGDRKALTC